MKTLKRYGLITAMLVLALGLLAACGGNENNTTELNENEGFGDADATLTVDEGTGLEPTPLAPELTITEAVTTEVEATAAITETAEVTPTMEMTATATIEPAAEVTATAEVGGGAEITDTAEITETGDITGTGTLTESFLVRASTLLDMELTDEVDETAGQLQDILFSEDGTLQYAVLDLDGADGTETVAVPWDQLSVQVVSGMEADDEEPEYGLTWADGAAMTTTLEGDAWTEDGITVDATALGLDLSAGATVTNTNLFRASAFVDQGLFDNAEGDLIAADGEELGELEDLFLDVDAGQIVYGVVEAGAFLLVDQRTVVIPWERLTFNETDEQFSTDVDQTELEESPEVDLDEAFADSEVRMDDSLRSELDAYWGIDLDADFDTD